jgi:hypothetical protein
MNLIHILFQVNFPLHYDSIRILINIEPPPPPFFPSVFKYFVYIILPTLNVLLLRLVVGPIFSQFK